MSAPRICTRCYAEVPGFHSYQKGFTCPECTTFLHSLRRATTESLIAEGKKILERDMAADYLALAKSLEEAGEGLWILDPQVSTVVALADTSDFSRAWLVVYLIEADWEVSDRFEERLYP